ncbi:type III-B CRISPR module RAMP protein Cmr4 [Haliscomenobacter hydrossis]|uniref:CRISPR-associated RAMP protein, Cmr4 family n=1 Tax=Haliscomenobacter hydrossis (strain ATCC 27775 / DSM 1100 / LMG 10767 / O) TaxID=760192 RepID=F4L834_HALH1|nr:type III-B CRISPR module RAMP protein Cmr4 [Haliscomenobacter hydrossis]AEE54542.1 CRISPR-associated RAMP protein, Cmr4 family [Haliscomenobacter hydrossis DSM 1100]
MPTQYDLFFLRALMSLHPGTGRSEFEAIDHKVQRDWRGFPTIHNSSLKGALREYLMQDPALRDLVNYAFGGNHSLDNALIQVLRNLQKRKDLKLDQDTLDILESELNGQVKEVFQAGRFSLHDAELLAIPVRSNYRPFFLVTCPQILQDLREKSRFFLGTDRSSAIRSEIDFLEKEGFLHNTSNWLLYLGSEPTTDSEIYLERFEIKARLTQVDGQKLPILKSLFGNHNFIGIVMDQGDQQGSDAPFNVLVDDFHLPIVPRNQLEHRISRQVWFEQVLHAETRFYSFVGYAGGDSSHKFKVKFDEQIDEKVINIAANLSVGYGRCEFRKLESVLKTLNADQNDQ